MPVEALVLRAHAVCKTIRAVMRAETIETSMVRFDSESLNEHARYVTDRRTERQTRNGARS